MEKQQAGIYKVTLYENKGFQLLYDSSGNISSILSSGEIFEFNTNDNKNKIANSLSNAENNIILNAYDLGIELNGLDSDTLEQIEKINNSIYGWIPLIHFMDEQQKLINTPFFQTIPVVNTQVSHTFKLSLKPRITTIKEFQDVLLEIPYGNGYLYNWYVGADANFMPTNWSVPTKAQFDTLIAALGGVFVAGGKMKETGFLNWNDPNTGASGTDGFRARGSGFRNSAGVFSSLKENAYFLTTDDGGAIQTTKQLYHDSASALQTLMTKAGGNSARGIYTGVGTPANTIDDIDNNTYDVVQIGSQYWTKQNWKATRLNNGTVIPNITDSTAWSNLVTIGCCAYDNNPDNV